MQYSAMENTVLDCFCFAEFLAYCTLENKSSKTCEYQPDGLDDNLIENNHEEYSYPKKNQIDISRKIMRCRKVRRIHRYHVPNKLLSAKKCAHYVLLLFYPFRDQRVIIRFSNIVSKQTSRAKCPECCKHKQNKV